MEKLIRDGKVAVLISEGYGGGWSTWNRRSTELLFDATVVLAVEKELPFEDIEGYLTDKYPDAYLSDSAYKQLVVYWLEQGTQFVVDEYDGLETLRLCSETEWVIA